MTNDEFISHIFLFILINGEWLMMNDEFIFCIFLLTFINDEWRMTKCFRAGQYHPKRFYLLRFLWFTASFVEKSSFESTPRWLNRKSSPFANGNLAHLNFEVENEKTLKKKNSKSHHEPLTSEPYPFSCRQIEARYKIKVCERFNSCLGESIWKSW